MHRWRMQYVGIQWDERECRVPPSLPRVPQKCVDTGIDLSLRSSLEIPRYEMTEEHLLDKGLRVSSHCSPKAFDNSRSIHFRRKKDLSQEEKKGTIYSKRISRRRKISTIFFRYENRWAIKFFFSKKLNNIRRDIVDIESVVRLEWKMWEIEEGRGGIVMRGIKS